MSYPKKHIREAEELKKFLADQLKLVDGKWQWNTRILEKADDFANRIYGVLPPCPDCGGNGVHRFGAIMSSQLGESWDARKHLQCKSCEGKGKIIP